MRRVFCSAVRLQERWANQLWRLRHDGSDFSIVADNCWAGFVYQHFRRPYLTPFVGLFIEAPCFLSLLEDLRGCLAHPLRPVHETRYEHLRQARGTTMPNYPIGMAGTDIEIHFLHYPSWDEAVAKWQRRIERIRWNRLYVKMTDRADAGPDPIRRFLGLPIERKIVLTNRTDVAGPEAVCLGGQGAVTLAQGTWGYRRSMDVPAWLSRGPTRGGKGLTRIGRAADGLLAAFADRCGQPEAADAPRPHAARRPAEETQEMRCPRKAD